MSMKEKNEIIFLIQPQERGQKDIDHYLPFFYFLSKDDTINYKAKGIIFDNRTNFSKYIDQRFKLLSELKNVEIEFLFKESILDEIKKILIFKSNSRLLKFFNKITNKLFIILNKFKHNKIDWKKKLSKEFLSSNMPLIFTMNSKKEELEIISQIKILNDKAKWIGLPHGTVLCDNQMVLETHLDKNETNSNDEIYDDIDCLFKTSNRDKEIDLSKGMENDKAIVIGSPRYCKEWIKIKSNLKIDGVDVEKNEKYKIKLLFLVPKKHINIFSEELVRSIDFISKYNEIELILLSYENHLPKLPTHIQKRENIRQYLISDKFSSSKLIDWADIVLHAGTGIVFESFVKEKITVLPRYLSCNTFISDKYNAGLNLNNRDELRDLLNGSVNSLDNLKKFYGEKCKTTNKKFIDEFVYANTESVSQNIINTMSSLNNKFKNLKH